ncbi:uncharacterized protein LOC142343987 [Convolutriloba macropyga]|uniref:uncharacterized protein LOC142343987 n=1 Tax=Convolutriloba macropyga TaxID=536237 RepID=UPI003F51F989
MNYSLPCAAFIIAILLHVSSGLWSSSQVLYPQRIAQSSYGYLLIQMPTNTTITGRKCRRMSSFFCLLGYRYTKRQSDRIGNLMDQNVFEAMIKERYRAYNWFSYYRPAFGGCCQFQKQQYVILGQNYGVGPVEYFGKVTDFSVLNKRLSYVSARYDTESGFNHIMKIGFGNAALVIEGEFKNRRRFIFPIVRRVRRVRKFNKATIGYALTFTWFKRFFICRDQPWMCRGGAWI